MASTTSNTDLVPREALDELKALDAQLKTTIDNMQALLKPVKEINNALSKSATNYKALTDAINKLNAVEEDYKKNATEHKRLKTEIEKLHVRLAQAQSAEAKEVAVLKEQIRQQNLEIKNSAREMLSASGSIDQLRARINVLTLQYNAMSEAVRNSDVGQNMQKQIKEMNDQVSVLEQGVGNYRRNVGNYASGFTPLQFQVQQLARELPSLTVSAQQFFLAISNNLPMLVEEMGRAKAANAALKEEGKSGVPVWKQLIKSILSWQTALVVGITVITAYGKEIGAFFKELFTGKKAIDAFDESHSNMISNLASETAKVDKLFGALKNATEGTKEFDKAHKDIIDNYGEYLQGMVDEEGKLRDIEAAYIAVVEAVQKAAMAKGLEQAQANAAKNISEAWENVGKDMYQLFTEKFGEKEGAKLLNEFAKGIESGITELTPELKKIYDQFDYTTTYSTGEAIDGVYTTSGNHLKMYADILLKVNKENANSLAIANSIYSQINNKEIPAQKSLIKEKEEELKLAQMMPESTEAEIRAKNQRIQQLTKELDRLKNLGIETDKLAETYKNLAQSQLEARRELSVSMMEASAEENKAIVENEKASYEDRIDALIAFAEQKKQAVQQSAQNQIDALIEETAEKLNLDANNAEDRAKIEKELADEIKTIRWKASEEAKAIDRERGETAIELEKQRVDGIINQITREAAARGKEIDIKESNALLDLSKEYAKGVMSAEEYEARKTAITRNAAKERFDAEWAMLNRQMEVLMETQGVSLDEILAIWGKMEDARVAYTIKANNDIIKNNDKTGRKLSEVPRKLKDLTKENIAQILQAWSDAFSSVMDLMSASLEGELNALDEEAEANEKWAEEETERIDRLEEAGAISKEQADARKAAVDDQAAAREAEIEQKKKDIQQRQARYDKASSAMKIMVSTAVAIMSAWELGPILGPILGALAAATGAAQLATVLATPIPEYAHGTQDHPGGLAVVGDGGRPEMIVTPGGSVYKTPATDTLLDLPEHSVVLPDFSQAINALAFEKLPEIPVRQTDSAIKLSEMEGLFKTTNKQIGAFMDSFNRYKVNRRYDSMFNRKKTTKIS